MAREPVDSIIAKTTDWPLAKRREYLIAALEQEKGRWRRKKIAAVLCGVTTLVLRQGKRTRRPARRPAPAQERLL